MTAFIDNTNLLRIKGLFNVLDAVFPAGATVTAIILDSTGAQVAGQVWPVTLNYETGTNGNYVAALEDDVAFINGSSYVAEITALDGASKGFWEFPFKPVTRTRK